MKKTFNNSFKNYITAYLLTHRHSNAAGATPTRGDAVQSPRAADGYERRVQATLNLHRHAVHVQRNQRRRIAPPVNVRLVARDIRIVHNRRIVNLGVHHRRRREVALCVRRHRLRDRRRRYD